MSSIWYSQAASAVVIYYQAAMSHGGIYIFICSTTGQGDEPDNMKVLLILQLLLKCLVQTFWRSLLRKRFMFDFNKIHYTIFGLGDSSYEKYSLRLFQRYLYLRFNFVARKLDKRLQQLGAYSFHSRGEGDDQHYLGYKLYI